MASKAKYSRAPQQEPNDDYTQAPPAYSAGPAGQTFHDTDTDPILGSPRSSEDNIPDDFKFGGMVAEATLDIRHQFIRKVYAILTTQLLVTAAVSSLSYVSVGYKNFIQTHDFLVWASLLGSFAFLLLTYWKRKSYPANLLFLSAFTLTEAYCIAVIVSLFDSRTVLTAVALTAGVFVFLTLFACQTKYDFTNWMSYLSGALWGLVLFGFVAMWFPYNSTAELVYGGLGALIFSGYILFDTQRVMRRHHVEEEIAAAISLYLDIINLFLMILRILNSQSNN